MSTTYFYFIGVVVDQKKFLVNGAEEEKDAIAHIACVEADGYPAAYKFWLDVCHPDRDTAKAGIDQVVVVGTNDPRVQVYQGDAYSLTGDLGFVRFLQKARPRLHTEDAALNCVQYILDDDNEVRDYVRWCEENGRDHKNFVDNMDHVYGSAEVAVGYLYQQEKESCGDEIPDDEAEEDV